MPVVERLDVQPIASAEQLPLGAVPDRECEHPAQVIDAVAPILLVQMDNRLGVTFRSVAVAGRFEISAQLLMVIDLAVEDDPDVLVFVGKRLMAGLYVDDAKAPHGQADAPLHEETAVVRTTMNDLVVHCG